jgi:hypothetical protein
METINFLDKVENIVINNFPNQQNVSQVEFLTKFASTATGKLNITKQVFIKSELNPRKKCIEKLLRENPSKWINARTKCQFIRTAKVK